MKYINLIIILTILFIPVSVKAFSNSLDGTMQNNNLKNNFSKSSPSNIIKNQAGQSFNPKEHTGFEHQDRNFSNPTMNDTRYNSNCQFGTCSPGGLNPNNK